MRLLPLEEVLTLKRQQAPLQEADIERERKEAPPLEAAGASSRGRQREEAAEKERKHLL